jgi:Rhodopirellula transposase DDE domain
MSSNAAGMWGWKRSGWGRRATGCWPRSRGWMNGRSAAGGRSWRRTWGTVPRIGCGRLARAAPQSKKDPLIAPALEALVSPETAGDPMSGQKWVRSSLRHLSRRLAERGHVASPPTVSRLLRKLRYSRKANRKERETGSAHRERDAQFRQIEAQKAAHRDAHLPIISVDTKKKELIGDFKNAGRDWNREAEVVNVHDFPSEALGRSVPYGVYDMDRNQGYVRVGTSADTPQFAVETICAWWETEGIGAYGPAEGLLILADAGGSNSCRSRVWKHHLQEQLCDRFGLRVTVCHYPTGCSKWNPVEHRLFGPISLNWAGHPLRTWETMLAYLRGTTNSTGLSVTAALHDAVYEKGRVVSDAAMAQLNLEPHAVCPQWSYTLHPRSPTAPDSPADLLTQQVIS